MQDMRYNRPLSGMGVRVFALLLIFARCGFSAEPRYVHSDLADGAEWGALKWSADDIKTFEGEPASNTDRDSRVVVRYSFFVSDYDVLRLTPLWVAHVDTKDSAAAAARRTGDLWDRGQYRFRPDSNVVAFSKGQHRLWVTNADYTNANPVGLTPVTAQNRITRGHMASNLEMKGHGTDDEGTFSQEESFSFANVVPQMQGHNAPLWAALEADCLALATRFGRVAVITGPVFHSPAGTPLLYTAGGGQCHIPVPTAIFKIIITTVNGRRTAIGFLIPHRPDLKADQRFDYIVPIRRIEEETGINVMPALGANDALEASVDATLVTTVRTQ